METGVWWIEHAYLYEVSIPFLYQQITEGGFSVGGAMEKEQEIEWLAAQNIDISTDLVAAAKQQLQFLAAVDRNRYLYEGLLLERAIYR